MTTELIAIEDISEEKYPAIYGKGGLDQFYEAVKQQVSEEVPDLSTKKGRDRIASLAAKVSSSKVAVEKPGREYLKQLKDLPKKIEAELREFIDKMDKLRDETRKPLTDWENAEKARIEGHKANIDALRPAPTDGVTSTDLENLIGLVSRVPINETWEEFEAEAHRVKAATLEVYNSALVVRKKYEAEQAELARLRAEAEERARKDREEQIAREAAEKAKREAEEAARLEKEKAEAAARAEREAAERRELELKLAAEQLERQKLAAEQAQKAAEEARIKAEADAKAQAEQAARDAEERVKREAEAKAQAEAAELARREADKKHKARINNEAVAAFVAGGFSDDEAKTIVKLIALGAVPNVKISY